MSAFGFNVIKGNRKWGNKYCDLLKVLTFNPSVSSTKMEYKLKFNLLMPLLYTKIKMIDLIRDVYQLQSYSFTGT